MDQAFATVIGMSLAYVASFVGMGLAWYGWKRRADREDSGRRVGDDPGAGAP